MFVNEDLGSLHILLLGTKETRYRTTFSPSRRRHATNKEVTRKTKKDHATQIMSRVRPSVVVRQKAPRVLSPSPIIVLCRKVQPKRHVHFPLKSLVGGNIPPIKGR